MFVCLFGSRLGRIPEKINFLVIFDIWLHLADHEPVTKMFFNLCLYGSRLGRITEKINFLVIFAIWLHLADHEPVTKMFFNLFSSLKFNFAEYQCLNNR